MQTLYVGYYCLSSSDLQIIVNSVYTLKYALISGTWGFFTSGSVN